MLNLLFIVSYGFLAFSIPSCDFKKSDKAGGVYVKPTITRTGKFRKGHVRKNVSTDKTQSETKIVHGITTIPGENIGERKAKIHWS